MKATNCILFIFLFFTQHIFGQPKLFSEEQLGEKPVYTNINQAYRNYKKVFKLALKGTGGYYGKVDAIPEKIDSLVYLQYFYVVNEALTVIPDNFVCCEMMQQLYLSGNKLKAIPDTLYTLKNLKRLDLQGNQLIKISEKIAKLTELEYLYLNDNKDLGFLPTDAIAKLKKLKYLNVKNTKVAREQLLKIQKLLPNAKVEF